MPVNDALMLIGVFAVAYGVAVAIDRVTSRWVGRNGKAARDDLRKAVMKPVHRFSVHRREMVRLPGDVRLSERGKGLADLAHKLDLGVGFCAADQRDAVFFVEGAEPIMCGRVILRSRSNA